MRIIGAPGTGKTTYLKNKVEELCQVYSKEELCLTSFTKASARVLAERVEGVDNIGTLHSLCFKNMGQPKIAETQVKYWNKLHQRWQLEHKWLEDSLLNEGNNILNEIQVTRARMAGRLTQEQELFNTAWEKWKIENDLYDFTDLIAHNLEYIDSPPDDPEVFIVDEAQDLTRLEMMLIKKWSKNRHLFIAGDSDQCLYGFKGSDPVDFSSLNMDVHVLEQSYRVPFDPWLYARNVIKRIKTREEVTYNPVNKPGEVNLLNINYNQTKLLEHIAKDEGEVMIIASCGYMLENITKMLKREGILYHNPYQQKWNPIRSGSATDALNAFVNFDNTLNSFLKWQAPLKRGVFGKGFKNQLEMLDKNKDLYRFTFEHFVPFKENIGDIEWYTSNLLAGKKKSFEYPFKILKKHGKIEKPRIIVGTIHSVKGGEADSVYIFPDLSAKGMLNFGDHLHRLFYVGMTRTRNKLNLCMPVGRNHYKWK